MTKQYYKFLHLKDGRIMSSHKDHTWEIGKEYTVDGDVKACNNGFHASELIQDALYYVNGEVLALVEGSGECQSKDDKVCYQRMKIVKAYKWTAQDNIALAIYSAEQVLKIYEDKYPNDSRPRDAIKAAKAYLKDPSMKNADAAARAADAARAAARAAADAARAAAYAADAAAYAADAAHAAARAAAYAADAAHAARAAAYAADAAHAARAAHAELKEKIHRYAKKRIKTLEEIK